MSKKQKIRKLTDAQYNEYLSVLRGDAALYKANGKEFVPPDVDVRKDDEKKDK